MPATFFMVRAVVRRALREKFDRWYSADHMPWAIKAFKCDKAWRLWSELEPGVHYAVYRFADKAACDAALAATNSRRWSPISAAPGRKASPARAT